MTDDDQRRETDAAADDVLKLLDQIAAAYVAIGARLHDVEGSLPERLYAAWLYSEFLWTESIADSFINPAIACGGALGADDCHPDAALGLTRSPVAQAFAAQQLAKARTLLRAYRAILRGDAAFEDLPRRWRHASLRASPVRAVRLRNSRRRRRPSQEEETTDE